MKKVEELIQGIKEKKAQLKVLEKEQEELTVKKSTLEQEIENRIKKLNSLHTLEE